MHCCDWKRARLFLFTVWSCWSRAGSSTKLIRRSTMARKHDRTSYNRHEVFLRRLHLHMQQTFWLMEPFLLHLSALVLLFHHGVK